MISFCGVDGEARHKKRDRWQREKNVRCGGTYMIWPNGHKNAPNQKKRRAQALNCLSEKAREGGKVVDEREITLTLFPPPAATVLHTRAFKTGPIAHELFSPHACMRSSQREEEEYRDRINMKTVRQVS